MQNPKRFLDRIKRAYEKTGMRPVAAKWLAKNKKSCCPLAALCIAKIGVNEWLEQVESDGEDYTVHMNLKMDSQFADGFMDAFDSNMDGTRPSIFEKYNNGFKCGQLALQELIPGRKKK